MLKSILILVCLLFLGCIEKKTKIEIQPEDRTNCRIEEVKDTTLNPGNNIVGYRFICDNYTQEINLLENNPWRHVGFSLLPRDNPYLKFGSDEHYNQSHKQGFIYFDLDLAPWDSVRHEFHVQSKHDPDSLVFTYAKVDCRTKSYLPEFVLTNYWLSAEGMKDTSLFKSRITFFLENQIRIYGANGDTIFNLVTNEYVSTGAKMDSTKRLLFFRTYKSDSISTYTGFEIHRIKDDTLLYKFETDSSYMVTEPDLFGNYVLFEVFRNQIPRKPDLDQWTPFKTIVYDISKNILYHWVYPHKYKFRLPIISGSNLIYTFGDDENVSIEYDAIPIAELDTLSK
ncbi:MAG TPA: hypothetical protein VJ184_07220 [Chryseolinea sp.]|nr:hypothetical protein [Chryseolinea sp.]